MTANARAPLECVAVFGSGMVAGSAALALARTVPRTTVLWIRTPADPAALADRLPASVPATAAMVETLGLTEAALVAYGAATHRLGEQWRDWGEGERTWTHGYGGNVKLPVPGALHHYWLEARRRGGGPAYDRLEPASVLAEADRFAPPTGDARSLLAQIDYGLRFDPERALPIWIEAARRAGVRIGDGAIGAIERAADGGCAAVRLTDGSRIAADLFIDATGPAAPIACALDDRFVDWNASLPCDRLLLFSEAARPSPTDRYRANAIGWRAAWPLADRTLAGIGYRSDITGDARARRVAATGDAEAEIIAFSPGRRAAPLTANVLALGDACAAIGPLGWAGLALAHAHLSLLLELLPGSAPDPLLNAEYNRRATLRADRVRDYLAAFYGVRPRRKGEYWQALRDRALPDGLAHTLSQFAQRGLIPHHDEEMFAREDWVAMLIGLGIVPHRRDPIAMSADPIAVARLLDQLAAATAELPAGLPPYGDYLAAGRRS